MKVILDTSVLIAGFERASGIEYGISVASIAELHVGVLRPLDAPRLAIRTRLLATVENSFDAIPFDSNVARAYAECAQAVAAIGRNPRSRVFDLMIAATARTKSATLLTLNRDDFVGLDGLIEIADP